MTKYQNNESKWFGEFRICERAGLFGPEIPLYYPQNRLKRIRLHRILLGKSPVDYIWKDMVDGHSSKPWIFAKMDNAEAFLNTYTLLNEDRLQTSELRKQKYHY